MDEETKRRGATVILTVFIVALLLLVGLLVYTSHQRAQNIEELGEAAQTLQEINEEIEKSKKTLEETERVIEKAHNIEIPEETE